LPRCRVTLLVPEAVAAHPATHELARDYSALVTVRVAPAVTRGHALFRAIDPHYEYQWRNAEILSRGLDEIGPKNIDFIVLPYLENIGLLHVGLRPRLFRGRKWATIAFRVRYHLVQLGIAPDRQVSDILQHVFLWWILRFPALTRIGTLDPLMAPAIGHRKIYYCPDPDSGRPPADRETARAYYGIRPGSFVLIAFGRIDRSKCIDVLLEGAALVPDDIDLTVFLAGQQNPDHVGVAMNGTAARRLRDRGALLEVNRYIRETEDIEPLCAADAAWVFYERKFIFTSNVMTRSANLSRPVIARRQGIIGQLVDRHEFGLTLPTGAPKEVADAITRLARDPDLRDRMGDNATRAMAQNTPRNFAAPIVDAIAEALAR
jgi:glycosyltransferase involved in cell wall biosynthesis